MLHETRDDKICIAAENAHFISQIGQSKVRITPVEIECVSAQLRHTDFTGTARASRCLLEQQSERLPAQRRAVVARVELDINTALDGL